jgi:hypothetical protein
MFMRSPIEASPLTLEVDTIGLENAGHPLDVRHLYLSDTAQRQLPADAPRLTIGFTNGFVESSTTAEPLSAALIGVGAAHGVRVDTFALNSPEAYTQEHHTDDAVLAYRAVISRTEQDQQLVGVGHSRGCITLTAVHEQLPANVNFSLNIAPPGCDPLKLTHKGWTAAVMAARMLGESQRSAAHLLKDAPRLIHGGSVLSSLGANGLSHIFGNGWQGMAKTIDEVDEIVNSKRFKYMERLVDLQNATAATAVVICGRDALCLPRQTAANLRAAGYEGPVQFFTEASHIDPLSRPRQYAPKIFGLLVNTVDLQPHSTPRLVA